MNLIFAIDPGTRESGYILYDPNRDDWEAEVCGIQDNDAVLTCISNLSARQDVDFACEMIHAQGMVVGKETFETCVWIGRFLQAVGPRRFHRYTRHEVKINICGSARAKDKNIRQAIIDRFGGDTVAIGGKKCQTCKGNTYTGRDHAPCEDCGATGWKYPRGPLHGIVAHVWSAMAVALTHKDGFLPF